MSKNENESKRISKRVILDNNGFIIPDEAWEESGSEQHGAQRRDLPPQTQHPDGEHNKAAPLFEQIMNVSNVPHYEVGRIKCPYCNKRFSIMKIRGHMRKVHHTPKGEIDSLINQKHRKGN